MVEIRFEELKKEEKILLLRAFDYDVDEDGFILNPIGDKIPSTEIPSKFLHIDDSMFIPGSLEVVDATPTSISKFIREKVSSTASIC